MPRRPFGNAEVVAAKVPNGKQLKRVHLQGYVRTSALLSLLWCSLHQLPKHEQELLQL